MPLSPLSHPPVPFEEDDKDAKIWFLDHSYLESMYGMFKKVNGTRDGRRGEMERKSADTRCVRAARSRTKEAAPGPQRPVRFCPICLAPPGRGLLD